MDFDINVLDASEKIIFALRTLYSRYGYERYRMGKFEEYDLYSTNKDFLVSDSVITFTDTNGKLMALKPDVTLSIIKNNKDRPEELSKLYYNENVYRVSKGSNSFREIMQTGLECIGQVDEKCISEAAFLAAESMAEVSSNYMLEISDLEILSGIIGGIPVSDGEKKDILKCVGEKNCHGILNICDLNGIDRKYAEDLTTLIGLCGSTEKVMPELRILCEKYDLTAEADRMARVLSVFEGTENENRTMIDFSAISDMNYYNGIVFRGFIAGVPDSVLSGGQYDRLMNKMGRRSRAIGFAVYLDKLKGLLK